MLSAVSWDGGGGDYSWQNRLNWSGDQIPGTADDVSIDVVGSPTIVFSSGSSTVKSLTSQEAIGLFGGSLTVQGTANVANSIFMSATTLILNGTAIFESFNLTNNSLVSHSTVNLGGLVLQIAQDATIDSTSRISADYRGFGSSAGPGQGQDAGTGGGGSYGGVGGNSSNNAMGGSTYGSLTEPVDLGSGGGTGVAYTWVSPGGAGGGAIRLTVGGTLNNAGIISADGQDTQVSALGNYLAGGGSGGSLWITAGTISGTGLITANGGDGITTAGGGGGGGRIAIYSPNTNGLNSANVHANGGTGWQSGQSGSVYYGQVNPTSLVLDLQAASDSGVSASDNLTNDSTPTLAVTVSQVGDLSIDFDGDAIADVVQTLTSIGIHSVTAPAVLSDGAHAIQAALAVSGTDSISQTINVTIDTIGPTLLPGQPTAQPPVSQRNVAFSEAIDPATFVAANTFLTGPGIVGSLVAADVSGAGTDFMVTFAEQTLGGQYTLQCSSTVADPAGNTIAGVTADVFNLISATVSHFDVVAPVSVVFGTAFSVTVTALDVNNQPVPNFTGMVHFSSSDLFASLPDDYTFVLSDGGSKTFEVAATGGVNLRTGGSQTVTATLVGSNPTVVGSDVVSVSLLTVDLSLAATLAALGNPNASATGDFNSDSVPDLAVINYGDNSLSVFRGNGDGTFTVGDRIGLGVGPTDLVVHDFNGDRTADIAATNYFSNDVSVLLGNGDGTFAPAASYGVGYYPDSVWYGDFDHNQTLDLVSADSGSGQVSLLLGNGDGTFHAGNSFAVGWNPGPIRVGDFNQDGLDDVVTGNLQSSTLSVLFGNSQGGLQSPINLTTTGYYPIQITMADFNRDGKLDIASGNHIGDDVSVFLNASNGTFHTPVSYSVGDGVYDIEFGDINGDNIIDLVVPAYHDQVVRMLVGNGDGTFSLSPTTLMAQAGTTSVALADWDGNGTLDMASTNYVANTTNIWFNQAAPANPHLSLSAPASTTVGTAFSIAVSALDENNQPIANFTGMVHFASSDPLAVLPSDAPFTASASGEATFSGIVFNSIGNQTITAKLVGSPASGTTGRGIAVYGICDGVLPNGAILHYTGNQTTADSAGNTSTTVQNNVTYVPGPAGDAFYFNGSQSAINATKLNGQASPGSGTFTVQAWVRYFPNSEDDHDVIITDYGGTIPANWGFWIDERTNAGGLIDGDLQYRLSFGGRDQHGDSFFVASNTRLNDREWHHVAAVRDGQTVKVFVDGLEDSRSDTLIVTGQIDSVANDGNYIRIGAANSTAPGQPTSTQAFFHGIIDNLAVISRALSNDEIYALATCAELNQPPEVDANIDVSLTEGGTYTLLAYIQDPDTESSGLSATVDFGDGAGPQSATINLDKTIALGHVYYEEPDAPFTGYTVTVVVNDGTTFVSDTAFVTVVNSAPSMITPGTSATGTPGIRLGDSGNVFGIIGDYGILDTHTVDVRWGDGTNSPSFVDQIHRTFGDLHPYTTGFNRNAPSDSLAIWKFDETSGTTVNDFARNNHGTNFGATIGVPGVFGTAYYFDGDDALAVSNNHLDVGASDFDLSVWVNVSESTPGGMAIWSHYSGAQFYGLGILENNTVYFGVRDAELEGVGIYGDQAINDGNWHFLEARRVGSQFSLSIDGVLNDQINAPTVGSLSSGGILYGRIGGGRSDPSHPTDPTSNGSFFKGRIDELMIYSPTAGTPWRSGFSVGLTVTDDDDDFTTAAVGIPINGGIFAVTDVDAAANEVTENAVIGTAVGITALATDPDGYDSVSYVLDDNAGGRFSIEQLTGIVRVAGPLDYETNVSHSIVVRATSTDGSSSTSPFLISVLDVAEGSVFAGGSGNDTFTFWPGPSAGQFYFKLNNDPNVLFTPTGSVTVEGGGGTDTLIVRGTSLVNEFEIHSNRIQFNGIDFFGNQIAIRQIDALGSGDTIRVFDGAATVNGNSGTDTLVAVAASNHVWSLTGSNSGSLDGAVVFNSIERLVGGSMDDLFDFGPSGSVGSTIDGGGGHDTLDYTDLATSVSVNLQSGAASKTGGTSNMEHFVGGSAIDTLVGPNTANLWTLTGSGAGNINSTRTFAGFENLTGGSAADSFALGTGTQIVGNLSGGGGADLVEYQTSVDLLVNLATSTASQIGGTFSSIQQFLLGSGSDTVVGRDIASSWTVTGPNSFTTASVNFQNVEHLVGGSATDTLIGLAQANMWYLTGPDAGSISGLAWIAIENLTGGSQTDIFVVQPTASASGTLSGGGGGDVLDYSSYGGSVTVNLSGPSGAGVSRFSSIATIRGTASSDVFVGANNSNTWTMTSTGGTVDGISFDSFEQWQGGTATDTLVGQNLATYWAITAANSGSVSGVNFSGMENLTGNGQIDTFAIQGAGSISGVVNGGDGADIVDFSGATGPVVVNLASNSASTVGTLSSIAVLLGTAANDTVIGANNANTWTITSATAGTVDTYSFSGFESLVGGTGTDTFRPAEGVTYLGTMDGGAGIDKLDYVTFNAMVYANLATGVATGISGVTNVENLTGGNGNDTLVGNASDNVISGGNGDDILLGGAGNDTLSGNNGRDLVIGGSGSDIVHGNIGEDILVAGFTAFANESNGTVNETALNSIMAEWTRTDLGYAARISHVIGSSTGGLNGGYFLNTLTVFDDGAVDTLFGETGLDWFLGSGNDDINETSGEVVTAT
jgi:Ca2+-binding RTX toxin-like protein